MSKALIAITLAAMASAPAQASESSVRQFSVRFEAGAPILDKESAVRIAEVAEAMRHARELEAYVCLLGESGESTDERLASIETGLLSETVGSERLGIDDSCPPSIADTADASSDSALVLLGTSTDIEATLDAAILAYSDYVPDTGWEDDSGVFFEGWVGRHLKAMGEPSFEGPDALDGFESRFRVAAYPNSLPAYAIRIDERAPDRLEVHWTLLDGAGGYDPGTVEARGHRKLSKAEARRFERLLEDAAPSFKMMEEPRYEAEDGTIPICIHKTHWTYETLDRDGRAFIERGFCGYSDHALDALGGFARELAGDELSVAVRAIRKERFGE